MQRLEVIHPVHQRRKSARKRHRKALSGGEFIVPTQERKRKLGGFVRVDDPVNPASNYKVYQARCECVLDALRLAGKIDVPVPKGELEAGLCFRDAYLTKAEGIKARDSTTERLGPGQATTAIERMTRAERLLQEAYAEMTRMQALVVVSVCGADETPGSTARLKTLRRGLDRLARLWGL